MKYFYVIKEYVKVLWQCLKYVYKFDKRGTIFRIAILGLFPVIANVLTVANARLADTLQQNFGTGLIQILLPIFFVIIGIKILDEIFTWLSRTINWVWRTKLQLLVDVERQKKRAKLTIPFIDSEDYEQLMQRMEYGGGGANAQIQMITSIPNLLRTLINIIFAVVIVMQFSPYLTLFLVLAALPGFSTAFTESFALRKDWEKNLPYVRLTGVYANQFSNYTNLKDAKVSGSSDEILKIYKDRKDYNRERTQIIFKKYVNLGFWTGLISLMVGFVVQYFVIKEVVFGTVLIGQGTLIIAQAFRLQAGLKDLAWFLPDQYENVVSSKYLFLYLETQENMEQTTLSTPAIQTDTIEIQDITFSYKEVLFKQMRDLADEMDTVSEKYFGLKKEEIPVEHKKRDPFTLTISSLQIKKGERIAIVGKNGNGKTTFIQLILNLYQPEKGTVSIFGNNIAEMNQRDIQAYYSTLFQDYGQTHLKVHEYIGLSEINNPNMDRIKRAAQLATADEFIEKWKDGYTQQLGIAFKGVKPSKGQWQKLALARAFYKEAPIIILDEPTSAIDSISTKKIFENLANIDSEKILLFVCHNMSDIPLAATRVLVFDQGKIVGDGKHKELLKTCEVYKELYQSERGK